jgi:hypothetical protein
MASNVPLFEMKASSLTVSQREWSTHLTYTTVSHDEQSHCQYPAVTHSGQLTFHMMTNSVPTSHCKSWLPTHLTYSTVNYHVQELTFISHCRSRWLSHNPYPIGVTMTNSFPISYSESWWPTHFPHTTVSHDDRLTFCIKLWVMKANSLSISSFESW